MSEIIVYSCFFQGALSYSAVYGKNFQKYWIFSAFVLWVMFENKCYVSKVMHITETESATCIAKTEKATWITKTETATCITKTETATCITKTESATCVTETESITCNKISEYLSYVSWVHFS